MKGTVHSKLRPVKFAFLVSPNDEKGLARAIELNSILWGGTYNPIIPTFKKVPTLWKKDGASFGHSSQDILKGYVDTFNPDFLVPLGKCKDFDLSKFNQGVIDDKRLEIDTKSATPDYGIGIFEVLQGFFEKELKFKRRYPINFILPSIPKKDSLFFQSIFGNPTPEVMTIVQKNWKGPLTAKDVEVDESNYLRQSSSLNLRKILGFEIEARNNSGRRNGECVFLMDASSAQDIIDYWNLRAMGWSVMPVSIQGARSLENKAEVQKFIEKHSGTSRHNPDIYIPCNLLKARNVSDEQVKSFIDSLSIKADEKARGSRVVIQNWYPRIWDKWARDRDGVGYCELESDSSSHDYDSSEEEVSVRTLDPKFAFRFGGHNSSVRFANDIATTNYGYDELYADVIPEGGESLAQALSSIHSDEWRFSKQTATFLCTHLDWNIYIKIPKAEDVFIAWMKDQGLEINLSAPGRIAKQMIKHLGGVLGINSLANENMISLLKRMESGKQMSKEAFLAEIAKSSSNRYQQRKATDVLKSYMERKVFLLGVSLQCPTCTHSSWYDIKSLTYVVTCTNCLEEFDIPTHSPNDIKWSYKTIGPFSLPKRADGVYPTLLTLRIFKSVFNHSSSMTPMLSFETKIDGIDMEIDLGLFFRESRFKDDDVARIVFAECKSENNFEKTDIDKMKLISEKFPGSVLVFATLKDELNAKEIALLKPLVNKCRRYYKAEEPYNPVMILTKTELYSNWNIYDAWEKKGGKHAAFSKRQSYANELLSICDMTQQIYLDMKPWNEFVTERFEKKRKSNRKMTS